MTKTHTTLTDLPPELWDHISTYLPTASSICALSRTNRDLHAFAEKDVWRGFVKARFPSLGPTGSHECREVARTLTSLSKAWDKRAFVARYVAPRSGITAFPGRITHNIWRRPRGQTIGFTPQLDVYEDIGAKWAKRDEVLAFSAGAEICIRHTGRDDGRDSVRWTTYRPHSASEGRDDVTALHILRPNTKDEDDRQKLVSGTANGDLQLITLPDPEDEYDQDVRITYFATQGLPVRSSSLLQHPNHPTLLAAYLGDAKVALYRVDPEQPKICPSSQFDMKPVLRADGNPSTNHRAWTTAFLSSSSLALGTGPSEEPIHIHPITESGLDRDAVRKISLHNDSDSLDMTLKKSLSSVYSIVPLPPSAGAAGDGQVFLSGAYDGIVRLHDLRSSQTVQHIYTDSDDSAIYSILPRGREKLVAGTSRHNLLKVFDMRLGAKCYNYLDAASDTQDVNTHLDLNCDYNMFLSPNNQSSMPPGSGWSFRIRDSSIYSLAASSPHSPFIYAGVENAIMSLAFTEMVDPHPDPTFFEPWTTTGEKTGIITSRTMESKDVISLAMYDQGANMKLCIQRGLWETWRAHQGKRSRGALDERWKGANESGP